MSVYAENEEKLLQLAKEKFRDLTKAEEELMRMTPKGEPATCAPPLGTKSKAKKQSASRRDCEVRAKVLQWLCTNTKASSLVSLRGVALIRAHVTGVVDLSFVNISFPLYFQECILSGDLYIVRAHVAGLYFLGSKTRSIYGDGLVVESSVYLKGYQPPYAIAGVEPKTFRFRSRGEVRFAGAKVALSFECDGARMLNPGRVALNCEGIQVERWVTLRDGFCATGEVSFLNASIGANFDCDNGVFLNPTGDALKCDQFRVRGSVNMGKAFTAYGSVRFPAARIEGNLQCDNGNFVSNCGAAIMADGLSVGGPVFMKSGIYMSGNVPRLRLFIAEGGIRLCGARIQGNIECDGAKVSSTNSFSLTLEGSRIGGAVYLRGKTIQFGPSVISIAFISKGAVRLSEARVDGSLDCEYSLFANPKGDAIHADGMKVDGAVFLRKGFTAYGHVSLPYCRINGILDCRMASVIAPKRTAVTAKAIQVGGDLLMSSGFTVSGHVSLMNATVSHCFAWACSNPPEETSLDLRYANVGILSDNAEAWPKRGELHLHGFNYHFIDNNSPTDAESRVAWLERQPEKEFSLQPYEKLAEVLRKQGHERDAKEVLIAKNRDRLRLAPKLGLALKAWYRFLNCTIGYGYKPHRLLYWAASIIAAGCIFFALPGWTGSFIPLKEQEYVSECGNRAFKSDVYPEFSPLIYSIDTFVPLVDLQQSKYFLPDTRFFSGKVLRVWMCFEIFAGWIIATLLVAALSGLAKT